MAMVDVKLSKAARIIVKSALHSYRMMQPNASDEQVYEGALMHLAKENIRLKEELGKHKQRSCK